MALVARSTKASMDDSTGQFNCIVAGEFYAGEALDAVAPVYIKASDGKVYMSDGTAANEAATVHGFTPKSYLAGATCSIYTSGVRYKYSDGALTAGDKLYLAATPGRLDDAATVGGTAVIATAINADDIVVGLQLNP